MRLLIAIALVAAAYWLTACDGSTIAAPTREVANTHPSSTYIVDGLLITEFNTINAVRCVIIRGGGIDCDWAGHSRGD